MLNKGMTFLRKQSNWFPYRINEILNWSQLRAGVMKAGIKVYYLRFLCYRINIIFSLNDKLLLPTGQLHQVLWKMFSP